MGRVVAKVNVTPNRATVLWPGIWPFPPDQEELIRRAFTQYLFYEPSDKNKRRCYCAACGNEFEVSKGCGDVYRENTILYGHKDIGHCPICDNSVTYLALGRYRSFNSLREIKHFIVFENKENGLYAMAIKATLYYTHDNPSRPDLYIDHYSVYCFTGMECVQWKSVYNNQTRSYSKWILQKIINEPFTPQFGMGYDGGYYVIGVNEIDKSPLKYCALDYYAPNIGDGYYSTDKLMKYLGYYTHRPAMEMVAKIMPTSGILETLVLYGKSNGKALSWKAKSPDKFLKLSKEEAKDFIKSEETFDILQKWRAES
ncbi:MAG: hypothetical protein RR051_07150, partial [Clostridiales bacterium]